MFEKIELLVFSLVPFSIVKMRNPWPLLLLLFFSCPAFSQTISTVAGNGFNGATGNGGLALNAGFPNPSGVCTDASGNLYITSVNSVRKIAAATGIVTNFAGNGTYATAGDGGPATSASLRFPISVCADNAGNVYIAEYGGHCIRKVSSSGIISTAAGNGTAGYSGDGGPAMAASLDQPWSVTVDNAGNLYIADYHNFRIRKVAASTGIMTTAAGTGIASFSGDGGLASSAGIAAPSAVFADNSGDVYFAEAHAGVSCRIRKITASTGIIATVAGNGSYSYSGDGGPALSAALFDPSGLAVDAGGNIYISTYDDSRIRKVTVATGFISTMAGTGNNGFSGDGGPAVNAVLNRPKALALDAAGNLYVADNANHRVRKIGSAPNCPAPTIVISTPSLLNCFNRTKTFTAVTTGPATPVFYQWQKNGLNYGTSNSVQSIPVTTNDIVTCSLTQTNSCGNSVTVNSNALTVLPNPGYDNPPEVTIAASAQTVCTGTAVAFTATNVSASSVLSWQWLVNGAPVGTNSPNFSSNALKDGDKIECIMFVPDCPGGSTKDYSDPIFMKVNPLLNPIISIAASANNICKGTAVTFTATAAQGGTNPLHQWKVNGTPAGSSNATFTSNSLINGDAISCTLLVDPTAQCASANTVTSNSITMAIQDVVAPSVQITASQTEFCTGTPVTFTALATNAGNVATYQWQINGTNSGNNGPQFSSAALTDGDKVSCTLTPANTSCANTAFSNLVVVRVHPLPVIQFNPSSVGVNSGSQAQLNAVVQGSIASYQWTPATLLVNPSSLTPTTVPLTNATTYQLRVQTTDGCEDSKAIAVTVFNALYMPTAFTPNGDGKNDAFRIPPGALVSLKEFSVFDRWGNKVFTTTDANKGWEGKVAGAAGTTRTFVYVIRGTDNKGEVFLKGTVTLIR